MKKFLNNLLPIVIILVGIIFIVKLLYPSSNNVDISKQEGLFTVKSNETVMQITAVGIIAPLRKGTITAKYSGYIKSIFVVSGQKVKERDPIVSISESSQSTEPVYPMRAPFDGTVVMVRKSEGEYVTQSSDAEDFIVRIDDLSKLFVDTAIPEIDMPKIKIRQKVIVRVPSFPEKTYHGIVRSIALVPEGRRDLTSRAQAVYRSQIEILDKNDNLHPGMSALADIILEEGNKSIKIPYDFVGRNGEEFYVILKNGIQRPITVETQTNEGVIVKKGLSDGDVIKQINLFSAKEKK